MRHRPGPSWSTRRSSSSTTPPVRSTSRSNSRSTGAARAHGGRTTLIVAHRLSTIALSDRVVLLDSGRIVADGTHAELLASSPLYGEVLAQVETRPCSGRRRRRRRAALMAWGGGGMGGGGGGPIMGGNAAGRGAGAPLRRHPLRASKTAATRCSPTSRSTRTGPGLLAALERPGAQAPHPDRLLTEYPRTLIWASILVVVISIVAQLGPKLTENRHQRRHVAWPQVHARGGRRGGRLPRGRARHVRVQRAQVRATGRLAAWVMNDLRVKVFTTSSASPSTSSPRRRRAC